MLEVPILLCPRRGVLRRLFFPLVTLGVAAGLMFITAPAHGAGDAMFGINDDNAFRHYYRAVRSCSRVSTTFRSASGPCRTTTRSGRSHSRAACSSSSSARRTGLPGRSSTPPPRSGSSGLIQTSVSSRSGTSPICAGSRVRRRVTASVSARATSTSTRSARRYARGACRHRGQGARLRILVSRRREVVTGGHRPRDPLLIQQPQRADVRRRRARGRQVDQRQVQRARAPVPDHGRLSRTSPTAAEKARRPTGSTLRSSSSSCPEGLRGYGGPSPASTPSRDTAATWASPAESPGARTGARRSRVRECSRSCTRPARARTSPVPSTSCSTTSGT